MAGPPEPRQPRLSREERRVAFLDAAASLVVEQGAEMLTMEGLAAAAGVNKALAYRHFDNRDDVLLALWSREIERLDEDISRRSGAAGGLEQQVAAFLDAWFDLIERPPVVLPRLAQVRTASGELERRRDERRLQIATRLAELLQTESNLEARDSMVVALMILTGSLGVVELWRQTGWPREAVTETFVRLLLEGVQGISS